VRRTQRYVLLPIQAAGDAGGLPRHLRLAELSQQVRRMQRYALLPIQAAGDARLRGPVTPAYPA
jgi:hypothetical protein